MPPVYAVAHHTQFVSEEVASVQDATSSRGMVALGSGWHEAFFDNFEVYPSPKAAEV